jgi:hypothetical protein
MTFEILVGVDGSGGAAVRCWVPRVASSHGTRRAPSPSCRRRRPDLVASSTKLDVTDGANMRKVQVRHDPRPDIGDVFELDVVPESMLLGGADADIRTTP